MWNHKPTAQELLDDRVRQGWQPTESAVHGDDKIEGYARCLVDHGHK